MRLTLHVGADLREMVLLPLEEAHAILDVGRYPSGVDDRAVELATLIDGSPMLLSEADDDVMTKKYGKLLVNLGNIADKPRQKAWYLSGQLSF